MAMEQARVSSIIYLILFNGVPIHWNVSHSGLRIYLSEYDKPSAEAVQIWCLDQNQSGPGLECTEQVLGSWIDSFDFADSDDPDEFLAPFPPIIIQNFRDVLIAQYRAAATLQGHHSNIANPTSPLPKPPPSEPILTNAEHLAEQSAQGMGFTGNACTNCGQFQLVRNGNCEVCRSCGETTGCS